MQIIDIPEDSSLLEMKLADMYCKHVLNIGHKEQLVLQYAKECGYEWCLWGSHSGHSGNADYHQERIYRMQQDDFSRPIRIVICSYPYSTKKYFWVDNLHSCICYIRKYGLDVKLKEIPFYIVDISEYKDIVGGYRGSVIDNPVDVAKAIECAYFRRIMSNHKELLKLDYLVSEFLANNMELYTYKNLKYH